jgi:hypothetical protein
MSIVRIVLLCVPAGLLSACGTMNSWLARNMGESVPNWAGGLPADAPPRPGTAQYEEYRRQLEGHAEHVENDKPVLPTAAESRASQAIY